MLPTQVKKCFNTEIFMDKIFMIMKYNKKFMNV